MEVEEKRDQKTVAIGAALGIFALIVVVGSGWLRLADSTLNWSDGIVSALRRSLLAVAGLAMVVYLGRNRRG